jgi:acylphosphatase
MNKSVRILVYGKVQGVYFRQSTLHFCNQIGLVGQVKNQKDGSVEIIVTGTESSIQQLLEWSKVGPSKAVVERVLSEEIPLQEFTRFTIVR